MGIFKRLFGRKEQHAQGPLLPLTLIRKQDDEISDEAVRTTICLNCGCGFSFKKQKTDQLQGETAICHCGHRFRADFYDEIIQFEKIAPNPCKEHGGPLRFS